MRLTTLLVEPMALAVPERFPIAGAQSLTVDEVLELPLVRLGGRVPPFFTDFWSLAAARPGSKGDFRGEEVTCPASTARAVATGVGAAMGTPLLARMHAFPLSGLIPVLDAPKARVALVSRIDDDRAVIDAVHREAASLVRRVGPLVLPELADDYSPW